MSDKRKKPAAAPAKKAEKPKAEGKPASAETPSAAPTSLDFEAGILFSKYDSTRSGILTSEDFRRMWRETKQQGVQPTSLPPPPMSSGVPNMYPNSNGNVLNDVTGFEAGKIFVSYDRDGDGKLNKEEFESLIRSNPDMLRSQKHQQLQQLAMTGQSRSDSMPSISYENISGRTYTHFDETANVAISGGDVEPHRNMGHTVVPLSEAYKIRYDRLRTLLASKILPRKEHLLQIRRHLQQTANEVANEKQGIERETLKDAEQIIERLRTIESMRQSAITHQTLQIDEDLQAIERIVRRVELANDNYLHSNNNNYNNNNVTITSAIPGANPVDVRAPKAAYMVELIQQFQDLCTQIDRASTKNINVQVDFSTADFPRETSERLELVAKCDRAMHAIQMKDQLLYVSLQEQSRVQEILDEEKRLSSEYAHEVTHWAEIANNLNNEISKVKAENDTLARSNRELTELLRRNNLLYAISHK